MRLHFAEVSNDRGQYDLLAAERATNSLLSYQYAKIPGTLRGFEHYWWLLLHLHLSGTGPIKDALLAEETRKHLMSYSYRGDELTVYGPAWDELTDNEEVDMRVHLSCSERSEEVGRALSSEEQESHLLSYVHRGAEQSLGRSMAAPDLRPRVIIDSGAFTAWRSGKPIRPEDYGEWAVAFRKRWVEKMKSLVFINLDVIGDQAATWANQAKLEQMGLEPVPVITRGATPVDLSRALDGYDYVCLGGLVPLAKDRKGMRAWLDRCFSEVLGRYHKTGVMPKIHLLGVTQPWVLMRYPAYSTDSSAWISVLRFGDSPVPGLRKVPRRTAGPGAEAANLHVLRSEIRRFKKMEADATALWASRGVEWED